MDAKQEMNTYRGALQKLYYPLMSIGGWLNEPIMKISDVQRILKISRRRIRYWDLKGEILNKGESESYVWRRFSIIDLLSFAIMKKVRRFGLSTAALKHVFLRLKEDIVGSPFFIYFITRGYDFYYIISPSKKIAIPFYHTIEMGNAWCHIQEPVLIIPVFPIFRKILEKAQNKNLYLDSHEDGTATFVVDGKPMPFDLTDEEEKILGNAEMLQSSLDGLKEKKGGQ
jgi:hypothetical protein